MEHSLAQNVSFMSHAPDDAKSADAMEVRALVRRTVAGDSAAFEQILGRYERHVLTLAMRFLGAMDEAQDAAQEVFLRAFKYMHRLDLEKPLEPWLMRITVNVCRDIGRKRQQRRRTFPDVSIEDAPQASDTSDPHSDFAVQQKRRLLWVALNDLPEKERMAIVLRDVEGLTTSEVAAILQSSETTVRSQISRARLKIKAAIDRMTGDHP